MKIKEILSHIIVLLLFIIGCQAIEILEGIPFGYYLIPISLMAFMALIASRVIHIKLK